MSRVGKKPIKIPEGVKVSISDQMITVEGSKGNLQKKIPAGLDVKVTAGEIVISPKKNRKTASPIWGLTRSLISNMVSGVNLGFFKDLKLVGLGYRVQAEGAGKLILHVGFSHPVEITAPEGVSFTVKGKVEIRVSGIDKGSVGGIAAKIRAVKPPEPYQGKGIRYVDEVIKRKAGKAAKVGTGIGGG